MVLLKKIENLSNNQNTNCYNYNNIDKNIDNHTSDFLKSMGFIEYDYECFDDDDLDDDDLDNVINDVVNEVNNYDNRAIHIYDYNNSDDDDNSVVIGSNMVVENDTNFKVHSITNIKCVNVCIKNINDYNFCCICGKSELEHKYLLHKYFKAFEDHKCIKCNKFFFQHDHKKKPCWKPKRYISRL